MKAFTVAEMLDAIEKNGLEQITESLFEYDVRDAGGSLQLDKSLVGTKVVGACALGMACINLGVKDTDDWTGESLDEDEGNWVHNLVEWIATMNDQDKLDFAEIAYEARKRYPEYLNLTIIAGEFEYSI